MIKRELAKPRKVIWVMRDFINDIHGLTYTDILLASKEDESIDEFFKRLREAEEVEVPAKVRMVFREDGFAVCPSLDLGQEEFYFYYNIDALRGFGHRQFSQDFFSRCPTGRGFASVTLAILHEIGHMNTYAQLDESYNRVEELEKLRQTFSNEVINFEYFKLPDEKAATDWAIEWLSHPENRKKAKEFEKKFFACFHKRG